MGARIIGDFPTGPLSDLYGDRYSAAPSLQYPLDVGGFEHPHYILFNINVPAKSSYVKNGSLSVSDQLSQVDINRAATNQLGSTTDPFSVLGTAGLVGAGVAAIGAISGGLKQVASGGATTASLIGSALPGLATGALTTGILASLDVTRKTRRTEQSIKLYVPNNIMQQYSLTYDAVSMTEAMGTAGLAAQTGQAAGGSFTGTLSEVKDIMTGAGRGTDLPEASAFGGGVAEIAGAAAAKSEMFGADIERVNLASYGYAKNPQIEVLFNSPSIRTFQFDFKFSPKSAKESQTIIDIIRTFKFHSAPELVPGDGGARYFIPPSEFDIAFYYNNSLNDKLFKITTCVCTGVDVNYVTAGQFATYYDGTPIEIEMVLKFQETEIIHKDLVTQGY